MKKEHVGKPVGATAVVTLTVEVRGGGSWGPDCSISQVHRQAAEEARNALRARLAGGNFTIVGNPEVRTVIAERS